MNMPAKTEYTGAVPVATVTTDHGFAKTPDRRLKIAGRCRALAVLFALSLFLAGNATAQQQLATEQAAVMVVTVATELEKPWSLAFLPDGRLLVSERVGRLRIIELDGTVSAPIAGVPEVLDQGQGGLLDVILGPEFATDQRIYFSYSEPTPRGARTAVASARLDVEHLQLVDIQPVFAQDDDPAGRHHFGSRLVFAPDGSLFVTLGDRFFHRTSAQTLNNHMGKIVRIMPDGAVPQTNPFVGRADARPEIWSFGHRNVQGAALHPETGVLWTHEHGPQGGDEINVGEAGANHGWPVITYGREYVTGFRIGKGTERDDVKAPVLQWTPSIAPSGMAFYTGNAFPQWHGNLFVGALRGQSLQRIVLDGEVVIHQERMLHELGSRIRDVREGPDGYLYLLDETRGRVLRLEPAH